MALQNLKTIIVEKDELAYITNCEKKETAKIGQITSITRADTLMETMMDGVQSCVTIRTQESHGTHTTLKALT